MRIIAGEFRGRTLLPPEGDVTRPITDRVKQSLFDILAPRIEGAAAFDLFAGTGSMGLECLSRGAAFATFFDADRSALARLRRNIDAVGVAARSKVIPGDLFKWFRATDPTPAIDFAFLDPPYRFLTERPDDVRSLGRRLALMLKPDGIVIFRHDAADQLSLPGLRHFDQRAYGGMMLEFLQADPPAGVAAP